MLWAFLLAALAQVKAQAVELMTAPVERQVVVVPSDLTTLNLSPYVTRYEFEQRVTDPELAYRHWALGDFQHSLFGDVVSTNLTSGVSWLAVELQSESTRAAQWVLSARDVMHMTRITLYVPVHQGERVVYRAQSDSLHDIDAPPLGTPVSSFTIDTSFASEQPLLIRVDGQLPIAAPLLLQSQQVAQWEAAVRIAITSLLFGAVIGLVLYNFVLYFFVRDITYLLYVAYASAMLLWLMQISGYMLLLDRQFGLAYYKIFTPNMSAGIANLFGSLFTVIFLRLYDQNRWQGMLVMGVAAFNVILGVASYGLLDSTAYPHLHLTQHFVAALSAFVIVVPTALLALQGYRFALPFILAWGSLGAGIVLLGLGVQHEFFGVPFPVGFNVLAAMVVEMVMMSYALGLRIQDVRKEADQLAHLSITDGLTGLFNQRHFHQRVDEIVKQESPVDGSGWACVMIDIDHFKRFNDSHGHLLGDKVLKRLGQIVSSNVRQQDMAFRVGGEEFALLLKTQSMAEALKIVERIRLSFEESRITTDAGQVLTCSLSAGVTLLKPQDSSEHFIGRADQALYGAKDAGRNCVLMGEGAA
tara:strand:- start:21930 stop:23684 length:1755 start_codon:yes stop_codon:yes gene_type:complete